MNRIDHVVLNCVDVDATADWYERVPSMRLDRWTCASWDDIDKHQRACGVQITGGPVTQTGALGPMILALLPRPLPPRVP